MTQPLVIHRSRQRLDWTPATVQAGGMAWVYILRCVDSSYYVGSTHNLDARLAQHAAGTADSYTEQRRPVTLAWAQEYERVDEAWAMERKIKGWRREKREALIDGRFADLPRLSTSGAHRSEPAPPAT